MVEKLELPNTVVTKLIREGAYDMLTSALNGRSQAEMDDVGSVVINS